jgi:RNA polymerase-interacting CarD/CdnL/TRCF family regulator
MKRTLSLTVEENIYQEVKQNIPVGEVSPLVNNLLKEYLKKAKEKRLIAAYKRMSKNKKLQKELAILERASAEDIAKKLMKDE